MFTVLSPAQITAQQRHLSHTFLVKLKPCNSLTFSIRVSPFFTFVVPGHFMTCNTPGFSRIITNRKQLEFRVLHCLSAVIQLSPPVCWLRTLSVQILVTCNSLLVTLLTVFTGSSLQFSGTISLLLTLLQSSLVVNTNDRQHMSVIHVASHLFCLLLPSLYLYPTPGSQSMSHRPQCCPLGGRWRTVTAVASIQLRGSE